MEKERLEKVLNNILDWVSEHDDEFVECAPDASDMTDTELIEYDFDAYVESEEEINKEEINMSEERLKEVLDNILDWVSEHDYEFVKCALNASGMTNDELIEYDFEDYVEEE